MESADVVVIGGGVIGASIAWHLAARGCTRVRVLERGGRAGQGSTGKATGGFRAQFASEVNVRLSLLSLEKLLRFRDELGVDPGYQACGYLFLAESAESLDALHAALAVQRAAGFDRARAITAGEARGINPAVCADGVVGGTWCPTDGVIRPLEMLRGYEEGARRLGVRFDHGAAVRAIDRANGRVAAVRTGAGRIAAGAVVNAAGAWAAAVGRMAGVEVPVAPLRSQVAPTVPTDVLSEDVPLTAFIDDGFHLRVRDGRVLMLWPGPASPETFDDGFDEAWLPEVTARAHRRVPCLRGVAVDRAACWCGLYEMSPDRHALLGRAPGVDNLWLANGSSGHGVMHSPAIGQLVAEMVLDGAARSLDVHALRPSRFAEGQPVAATRLL